MSEAQRMRDWLRSLGAPESILQVDLSPLLRPEDQAMWRHLQRHVLPATQAARVREAILLDKLTGQGLLPGAFGEFKVHSAEEGEQVQLFLGKREELGVLKLQIEEVDENLRSMTKRKIENSCKIQRLIRGIQEKEAKTQLIQLKTAQVKKNIEHLDHQLKTVRFKARSAPVKARYIKMVESLVCNFKLEDLGPEGVGCALASLAGMPAPVIVKGIERASKAALLKMLEIFRDFDANGKTIEEKLLANGSLPIEHLTMLEAMYLDNESKLSTVKKDFAHISEKLDEEKTALIVVILESLGPEADDDEINRALIKEFVDLTARRALNIAQVKQARVDILLENVKLKHLSVNKASLEEKCKRFQKCLDEKLELLKSLGVEIVKNNLSFMKTEALKKCTVIATEFRGKMDCSIKDPFRLLGDLMNKEVEMLIELPLKVVTRTWEDDEEGDLPEEVLQRISSQPLMAALVQSHPTTALVTVLQKLGIHKP